MFVVHLKKRWKEKHLPVLVENLNRHVCVLPCLCVTCCDIIVRFVFLHLGVFLHAWNAENVVVSRF